MGYVGCKACGVAGGDYQGSLLVVIVWVLASALDVMN